MFMQKLELLGKFCVNKKRKKKTFFSVKTATFLASNAFPSYRHNTLDLPARPFSFLGIINTKSI